MKHKCITKVDVVLVCGIVLFTCFLLLLPLFSTKGGTAVVKVGDKVVAKLPLNKDTTQTIKTEDGYNLVVVKNGVCFVEKADCRDGICVARGEIHKKGESIVCLPHKLIVEVG